MNEQLLQQIDEIFARRLEEYAKQIEQKFDLLIELQQRSAKRYDAKVDAVAADLAAHRRDTEAHSGYRVGE